LKNPRLKTSEWIHSALRLVHPGSYDRIVRMSIPLDVRVRFNLAWYVRPSVLVLAFLALPYFIIQLFIRFKIVVIDQILGGSIEDQEHRAILAAVIFLQIA
jgi:hypothetical protein